MADSLEQLTAKVNALLSLSPPIVDTPATVSGDMVMGRTVTAVSGAYFASVTSTTWQWLRNGTAIAGATSATYRLASADLGAFVTVEQTAANGNGQSPPVRSAQTELVRAVTGLDLSPPVLTAPTTINLTDGFLAANPEINLLGADGDWIITLPDDVNLTREVVLHGRDQARHIVIVGGGIETALRYDPATMRMLDSSDWAIYALRGFTGATGGTFRFRVMERDDLPGLETADLPYDANAATIKAAIEAVTGAGSVFAVEGSGVGGPWKIVPANNPLLGRPVLLLTGLTGNPAPVTPASNIFNCIYNSGITFKNWKGVAHLEGVHIGGPAGGDGIRCQNPRADAVLQLANVRTDPEFHPFHDDWFHPDGAQYYSGPSTSYMQNVELRSVGGNGFIAQPRDGVAPATLTDWWFRNCHFRALRDDRGGRVVDSSTALYRVESYPTLGLNELGQLWDMQDVYVTRGLYSSGGNITTDPEDKYLRGFTGRSWEPGLTIKVMPPEPVAPLAGPGYVSPGYSGNHPGPMPQRFPVNDPTPNPFAFAAVTGAALSAVTQSNAITVTGINIPANVAIVGGEYQVNGGAWSSADTTVVANDVVRVRLTSSASGGTAKSTTLTIGGVAGTFTVTTAATWTPSELGSAVLSAWYDPSDAATLTLSSGAVTAIADKSGNARGLTASAGAAPTSIIHARTALLFNADRRFLSSAFGQPAQYLVAMVVRTDSVAAGSRYALAADAGGTARHAQYLRTSGATVQSVAFNDALVTGFGAVGNLAAGTAALVGCVRNAAGIAAFKDAVLGATTANAPPASRTVALSLGGLNTSNSWVGAIGETLVVNITGMTGEQVTDLRTKIGTYLSGRWIG